MRGGCEGDRFVSHKSRKRDIFFLNLAENCLDKNLLVIEMEIIELCQDVKTENYSSSGSLLMGIVLGSSFNINTAKGGRHKSRECL